MTEPGLLYMSCWVCLWNDWTGLVDPGPLTHGWNAWWVP